MRKGWTAFALLLVMCLTLLPGAALAADLPAFSGTAGENIKWEYDFTVTPGTITFSGSGPMADYDAFGVSHDWNRFSKAAVVIGDGITRVGDRTFGTGPCVSVAMASTVESIGSFAFSNCRSLTTVNIDNSNIAIAENAFQECDAITSFVVGGKEYHTPAAYLEAVTEADPTPPGPEPVVNYVAPDGTTTIDEFAFQDCETLETVALPEGVTTIGASAFIGCVNLKSVTLPSTLTTIGGNAFDGCTSLESIQLPERLETLGNMAFKGCTSLTSIIVPKNITNWGVSAFAECTGLTQLTLSQGLAAIGASAFYDCPGLTSVTIPDSVRSIGDYAFRATGLTGVTIPQSVTHLGEYPFGVAKDFTWVTDFTITGYAGTEAEAYAKDVGFPFVDLTPAPGPVPSGPSRPSRHAHVWDNGTVTLEPTALTGGLRTYTCKRCGATKTESISAGYAAPVIGSSVTITGAPSSKDPTTGFRIISSRGTDPDARGGQAYASTQSVEVDGKAVEFQMYALKDEQGNDTNYVKLRDVALTIDRTKARCNVDWLDGYVTVTTGTPYQPNGSEMQTPFTGDRSYDPANAVTMIDEESVLMQSFVLVDDNGGGYTYYKLRDLGQALGFNVGWSGERGVYIETDRLYDVAD